MTRRSKVWLVVAVLFTLVNFGGGVFAVVQGELLHGVTHAGLLVLGAYWTRLLWRRADKSEIPAQFGDANPDSVRVGYLEFQRGNIGWR